MNPKVDFFFNNATKWQPELVQLREIVLDCNLKEELKWGCPCYTYPAANSKKEANIVLIHAFKEYCALLFFKGALLSDPYNILIQQTENVQAARQLRFTNLKEITALKKAIKAYIFEAEEVEESGLKVEMKAPKQFEVVDEFQVKLDEVPRLKSAFEALSPGRQRAYLLHFSQAKLATTRAARVAKCIPDILNGKGLND